MKQKIIEVATFVLFLVPLLVIIGNPNTLSLAMDSEYPSRVSSTGVSINSFYSMGGLYDGWILESGEFTGVGSALNIDKPVMVIGDDAKDRQYRSILSFNTTFLPPNPSIQSVTLYLTGNGFQGLDPFGFGDLRVDIKSGVFGTNRFVEPGDFQANANLLASVKPICVGTGKCAINLRYQAFSYINTAGPTQFRLRFTPDDNDNMIPDYYRIFSGDTSTIANKPRLVVRYYP